MAKEPFLKAGNPVFAFMGKLGDVVLLNVLWLLCCLPVVTAGASTTALFYAARKIAAGEEYRVRHDFFHSFQANWRQATLFWLGLLAFLAVGEGNLWIGLHTDSGLGNLCRGVGGVLLALWLAVTGHAFPLLARYNYRLGRLVPDALRLAVTRPHITVIHVLLVVWLPALLFLDGTEPRPGAADWENMAVSWEDTVGSLPVGVKAPLWLACRGCWKDEQREGWENSRRLWERITGAA